MFMFKDVPPAPVIIEADEPVEGINKAEDVPDNIETMQILANPGTNNIQYTLIKLYIIELFSVKSS